MHLLLKNILLNGTIKTEKDFRIFWMMNNHIEDMSPYDLDYSPNFTPSISVELKEGILSYETTMQFYLDKMIRDGVIYSVDQFFEDLFRICKDKDSLNQISNAFGMNKAKQVSIDALLDKLPLGLGNVFIQEKYFCVKNMER